MERFRDLTIHCDNPDAALLMLKKIMAACKEPPFQSENQDLASYKYKDDIVVRIIATLPYVSAAVLILTISGSDVKVVNIIPHQRSVFRIDKNQYNYILSAFKKNVIDGIVSGDRLEFPPAEYSMDALIPKSYKQLDRWANCPGAPDAPFSHPSDLNQWYDFIIALVISNEKDNLSSGDLEQWLEEKQWDEDVIEETILHYEHDTELLEHYNNKYGYNLRKESNMVIDNNTRSGKFVLNNDTESYQVELEEFNKSHEKTDVRKKIKR